MSLAFIPLATIRALKTTLTAEIDIESILNEYKQNYDHRNIHYMSCFKNYYLPISM